MPTREELIQDASVAKRLGDTQLEQAIYSQLEAMPQSDPTHDASWYEKMAGGVAMSILNTGMGVRQLLGMESPDMIQAVKEGEKPLLDTGWGKAGNIMGQIAQTFATPGGVPGSIAASAALEGVQPVADGESRLGNAALGAGGALAGAGAGKLLGKIIQPVGEKAQALIDEGMPRDAMTPGQLSGGIGRQIEELLKSVPFAGQMIGEAETKARQAFNTGAYQKALDPIGLKVDDVVTGQGHNAIEEVGKAISDQYSSILPGLKLSKNDPHLAGEVARIVNDASQVLPPSHLDQFTRMVSAVDGRIPQEGILGEGFKRIDSDLGHEARSYLASNEPANKRLGTLYGELRSSIKDAVERQNPGSRADLQAVDNAYANLSVIRNAASKSTSTDGIFTPASLRVAAGQGKSKKALAEGNALLQNYAELGKDVLGSKVPDSGTPIRSALLTGAAGLLSPKMLVGIPAVAAAYSEPGQALLRFLASRPEAATPIARAVDASLPVLARLGAASSYALTR